jgi:hypothetical protein
LEQLASEYGIDDVVVEHTTRNQPCNALELGQLPSMEMKEQLTMTSSRARFNGGTLTVFHFIGPRQEDGAPLKMKVPKLQGSVAVTF